MSSGFYRGGDHGHEAAGIRGPKLSATSRNSEYLMVLASVARCLRGGKDEKGVAKGQTEIMYSNICGNELNKLLYNETKLHESLVYRREERQKDLCNRNAADKPNNRQRRRDQLF